MTSSTENRQSPVQIVEQDYDNLLEMISQQRKALLQGPRITVYIGETAVEGISKRAAMASSLLLNKHFKKNPDLLQYRFSKDRLSARAIRLLLITWMQETCQEFEAHAVPAQETFSENLDLLRASWVLGMDRYTKHIFNEFKNYLKRELPSYEEIILIEQSSTSDKDPLWTSMVNHLAHMRHERIIPDPEKFAEFLEEHQRLRDAMKRADEFFLKRAQQDWEAKQAESRQLLEDGDDS